MIRSTRDSIGDAEQISPSRPPVTMRSWLPTLSQGLLPNTSANNIGLDFAGLLLTAVLLRLPLMFVSVVDWDESAFTIAAREILRGHLPYTTFFDNKPVGSSALLAAAFGIFGASVETARLVGLLAVTATSWCIYLIARRFEYGRAVNLSAALLYIAFSTGMSGVATMTEIMLAPFTAGAVLLLIHLGDISDRAARIGVASAAGLLFGIAVWIKYVPVAPAGCVGLVCLFEMAHRQRVPRTQTAAAGVLFVIGVALPTLATVLIYWLAGLLPTFWYANFGYVHRYIGMVRDHSIQSALTEVLLAIWPLVVLTGLLTVPSVAGTVLCRERRYPAILLVVWLVGELVAAVAPLQFYQHYFLALLPPLCVLAALVIWHGVRAVTIPSQTRRAMAACILAIALVPLLHHAVEAARALTRPDIPRQIAAIVRRMLGPGETVYVVNDQPIIYLLSRAPLPTAYAFPTHLIGPQRSLVPIDRLAELARILSTRPRVIVVDESAGWADPAKTDQTGRAMIESALAASYHDVAAFASGDSAVGIHVLARHE